MRHLRRHSAPLLLTLALHSHLPGQDAPMYMKIPNSRATVAGSKTAEGYRLSPDQRTVLAAYPQPGAVVLQLPALRRKADPVLAGILRHGTGIEVFLIWMDPNDTAEGFEHHIEIFRGEAGGMGRMMRDVTLFGGPAANVSFFEPPDTRDVQTVVIDVMGGSYWGTSYWLSPDREVVRRLFSGSDYDFADLNGDGVYELISWNRRPFDVRCRVGIFARRFYPTVLARTNGQFAQVWPPNGWSDMDFQLMDRFQNGEAGTFRGQNLQVVGGFSDLNRDGKGELIVLEDKFRTQPAQSLAVYGFDHGEFHLVARAPLPPNLIAYLLSGIEETPGGAEIVVHLATPKACESGFDPNTSKSQATYVYHGGKLEPVPAVER